MKGIKFTFPTTKRELLRQNDEIRTRLEAQERRATMNEQILKAFENMSADELRARLNDRKQNLVSTTTAMETVALADSVIRYLARKLSTMQLQHVKVKKDGGTEIVENNFSRLLKKPNYSQTWHDLFKRLYFDLNIYGSAYIYTALSMPNPNKLWVLPAANMVRSKPLDPYLPATEYEFGLDIYPGGRFFWTTDEASTIGRRNLIVFQNQSSTQQFQGSPVMNPILRQLGVLKQMQEYQTNLFENMDATSGVVWMKNLGLISDDEIERTNVRIRKEISSPANAGKITILPDVAEFKKNEMEWGKLGIEETKQLTEADVLSFFGVPAELWGDVSGQSTYNNKSTALEILYKVTLIPWMIEFLETINNFFYPDGDYRFEINIKTTPYYLEYCKAVDSLQSRTLNEKRVMQGLPPLPNGDVIIINGVALDEILGGGQKLQL